MTLRTKLVTPEGAIWSGDADRVIAKTLDGDIGVLTGHAPVLGILVEGSLVRILPENEGQDRVADWVTAAISGGFFSVADNRVSILARQAQLGSVVDQHATRATLDQALQDAEAPGGDGESADVRYLRALLTASGDTAGSA
jgi:F-type H+-transporting ATPase subunit epsilon